MVYILYAYRKPTTASAYPLISITGTRGASAHMSS
jgi:hypothetical protein